MTLEETSTAEDKVLERLILWFRQTYPASPLNDVQIGALRVLESVRGLHNWRPAGQWDPDGGFRPLGERGVEVRLLASTCSSFATYDFDELTRLVLAAHKHRVRLSISGGAGNVGLIITLHQRKPAGENFERHPGLDDLAARIEAFR